MVLGVTLSIIYFTENSLFLAYLYALTMIFGLLILGFLMFIGCYFFDNFLIGNKSTVEVFHELFS
jgi:hypothetical protein